METLGVYIQVPFCASKCSFCNFSSQVAPANGLSDYAQALEREINLMPSFYEASKVGQAVLALPVDTLYLGGGTPPLLGAPQLRLIISALRRGFQFSDWVEFTLEVTPDSPDDGFLEGAFEVGVNRLSIGAQSFQDRELRAVGRLHSAAETRHLVRRARRAGFAIINLDLIAGLPYQNSASWANTVREAAQLEPEHVSVYLFEVDDKSRLGNEVLAEGSRYHAAAVPDENFMAEAYELARRALSEAGYVQYEISNFARPGYESCHNRKYWQLEPYIGLGAGAHSFDGLRRWVNEMSPEVYREKLERGVSPIAETRLLTIEEQLEEFFFLGLRQHQGIDLSAAVRRWGRPAVSRWHSTISGLERDGLLVRRGERLRVPEQAYLVSNEIFQQFLL